MRFIGTMLTLATFCGLLRTPAPAAEPDANPRSAGIEVGTFDAEVRAIYGRDDGLPTGNVWSVAITDDGRVFAGTRQGLYTLAKNRWVRVNEFQGGVKLMTADGDNLFVTLGTALYRLDNHGARLLAGAPENASEINALTSLAVAKRTLLGTTEGLFELADSEFQPVEPLNRLLGDECEIRQVATCADGRAAVAAPAGLFLETASGAWHSLRPEDAKRSWAPRDVRGVTFDATGRLWFASLQGVGCLETDGQWSLYTGYEGLPYDDFTTVAAGEPGVVWFGTRMGAIRFDGDNWNYRRGRMWLPDDHVQAIAVDGGGDAWFATAGGAGLIDRRSVTFAEKARLFEEQIDEYHRRTPFGYVLSVRLKNPGDKSEYTKHDSDNDGLWTSMYGAAECFAYAATGDPQARRRAEAAFEAVRFLSRVTQGGSHPAPPGFPARTILPASAGNPNEVNYTPERDRERQQHDPFWKVIVPRWPLGEDGQWYWKCDTSSDELDGHFFFYAAYYDLVAETEHEKARARDVITAIVNHLIEHGFELVDHDGRPTRWARYSPEVLNGGLYWPERGLNSLSMLSYLKVAEHVSGGRKYRDAYNRLIEKHAYDTNVLNPKLHNGAGSGNQSDDEMAFMCFYNLLKYEDDPNLRETYTIALRKYWAIVEPEMCPLFNFIFAASHDGRTAGYWEGLDLPAAAVPKSCLADAVDCLRRYPLQRFDWGYRNSHRIDVVWLPEYILENRGRGMRRNGKVVPIDERFVDHWNHNPWQLDSGGNGTQLCDGASFLLPYYMGLYHGFIVETAP